MKRSINFDRPRGVVTNGEDQHFDGHLNLTRSLADVWAQKPAKKPKPATYQTYERQSAAKAPYAGRTE